MAMFDVEFDNVYGDLFETEKEVEQQHGVEEYDEDFEDEFFDEKWTIYLTSDSKYCQYVYSFKDEYNLRTQAHFDRTQDGYSVSCNGYNFTHSGGMSSLDYARDFFNMIQQSYGKVDVTMDYIMNPKSFSLEYVVSRDNSYSAMIKGHRMKFSTFTHMIEYKAHTLGLSLIIDPPVVDE